LYEEYRGFFTLTDKHLRTNPTRKDLFFWDKDNLVKQYFEPTNAIKMDLHYIDNTMMKYSGNPKDPDNRNVNFNSERFRYARQYALVVYEMPGTGDGVVGFANSYAIHDGRNDFDLSGGDYSQRLKATYVVQVWPGAIINVSENIRETILESTVIHEIGHAIGIPHHGGDNNPSEWDKGLRKCAMRYYTSDEYPLHPEYIVRQTVFCTSNDYYQNGLDPVQIKAHDCWGKINVKMKP
jgi:hypothetical protein